MKLEQEIVEKVCDRFQTTDVFEIARRSGIGIVSGKWFPVTAGEFCRQTKTITVNENAGIPRAKIVAHELGHYFAAFFGLEQIPDEERFCDAFALQILRERSGDVFNDEQ